MCATGLAACGGSGGGPDTPLDANPPGDPPPDTPSPIALQAAFPALTFNQPLLLLQAPGDSSTWYVVERTGVIRAFDNDAAVATTREFIDLSAVVDSGPGEAGLLGMAFHPDFGVNRQVFLSFTISGSPLVSRVERFTSNDGGLTLDPASRTLILSVAQEFGNHNGGHLAFGPDGYLYVGFGDGGSGGDPNNRGQTTTNLLGTIARIDVDGGAPYGIPPGNPFAGNPLCSTGIAPASCPEIFAYGLRNPWRFSFDRLTGEIYAGDVGQSSFEEIDRIVGGNNYGWNIREGANCFISNPCTTAGLTDPIHEYGRSEGTSVTGGYVYRGTNLPALTGLYVFGDFVSGRIWSIDAAAQSLAPSELLIDSHINISSFGESHDGELFVVDYGGSVYEIVESL